MAKKGKHTPKYLQSPPLPTPIVKRGGNPERQFSFVVPVLSDDGTLQYDQNQKVKREEVTEKYVWNQKHRTQWKTGNGRWTIPPNVEAAIFLMCRFMGCFKKWKENTSMGWGVYPCQGQAQILGQGVRDDEQMIDVKVCKFVEGNKGCWHGYPIDYREGSQAIICDNALSYWEKLHLIDKSEIDDIRNKEDSSLV